MAKRFWPNESAVGKRMYQPGNIDKLTEQPPDKDMMIARNGDRRDAAGDRADRSGIAVTTV